MPHFEMKTTEEQWNASREGQDLTLQRGYGWRASKGPNAANQSGFRATGHRVLLLAEVIEEVTAGGIVLAQKTLDKERTANMIATVIEIGHDAWSDKSTDYCDIGDKVLVGQYSGKFEKSPVDGQEYRFINDLDIISPIVKK